MITVLIIDDEQPARELIRHYLKDYSEIAVAGEASNGFDALKLVKEHCPQLIFMDVQMPKLTGFETLELMEDPPEIIFCTAFDNYALRAFEMNAADYLLKPYSAERFHAAVQKAIARIEGRDSNIPPAQALKNADAALEPLVRIAVKQKHQIHVIPINDIDYIESDGDYVQLHTKQGIFLKEKTMKFFETNLPPQFVRVHRSYIVNVDKVVKIELYEKATYCLHLCCGATLKSSAAGYKLLRNAVKL